jgi:hypothetical protein
MKKYSLRIYYGDSSHTIEVIANEVIFGESYLYFYIDNKLVATYPPGKTSICGITDI